MFIKYSYPALDRTYYGRSLRKEILNSKLQTTLLFQDTTNQDGDIL